MVHLSGHMTSGDQVIGMEYLTDSESVCLAISSGNILLLNVTTSTYELESVGKIEVGVVCMASKQDIVVMVTGEDKLVLMTKDFDPLTETEGLWRGYICEGTNLQYLFFFLAKRKRHSFMAQRGSKLQSHKKK